MNKIKAFFKSETVLCIATVLAVISMFIIPIDAAYVEYIDVKTLALLFSLMVVMAGLQKQGIFTALASAMLPSAKHTGQLRLILVFYVSLHPCSLQTMWHLLLLYHFLSSFTAWQIKETISYM